MFRLNKHILRYILNNPSETYTTSKVLHTFYNNNELNLNIAVEFRFDYKIIFKAKNYTIWIKNVEMSYNDKAWFCIHTFFDNLMLYCEYSFCQYYMIWSIKKMLCLFSDDFFKTYQDCTNEEYKIRDFCYALEINKEKIQRFYLKNKNVLTF